MLPSNPDTPRKLTLIGILVVVFFVAISILVEFTLAASTSLIAQALAFTVALCAFVALSYLGVRSLRQL